MGKDADDENPLASACWPGFQIDDFQPQPRPARAARELRRRELSEPQALSAWRAPPFVLTFQDEEVSVRHRGNRLGSDGTGRRQPAFAEFSAAWGIDHLIFANGLC
jgi:hypothetical protein